MQRLLHRRKARAHQQNARRAMANGINLHAIGCPSLNWLKKQFPVHEIMAYGNGATNRTFVKQQVHARVHLVTSHAGTLDIGLENGSKMNRLENDSFPC